MSLRAAALLLAAAGCVPQARVGAAHGSPMPAPHERAPTIELLAIDGRKATFVRVAETGVAVTATVVLPNDVIGVAWVGADPVALLGTTTPPLPDGEQPVQDPSVGHITRSGFQPIELPDWPEQPPPAAELDASPGQALAIVADDDGVAWLARCDYWAGPDGGGCVQWRAMRLEAPHTVVTALPTRRAEWSLPAVPPSTTTVVRIAHEQDPPAYDGQIPVPPEGRDVLACDHAGRHTEYPPADARSGFVGMGDLHWIVAEPPIYTATEGQMGFSGISTPRVFEGCALSTTYGTPTAGPADFVALPAGDTTLMLWRGRRLGAGPGASLIEFAPRVR